jgi:glycosyltransferase involved in cell wall biosynthesis
MKILQINTQDIGGGAERVALDLHTSYLERGLDARLGVRFKRSNEQGIFEFDPFQSVLSRGKTLKSIYRYLSSKPHFKGRDRAREILTNISFPGRFINRMKGIEEPRCPRLNEFDFYSKWKPDIIHCHNMHGNYFNLESLESLKNEIPIVLTLHDTWAFTGHCAYFLDCELWEEGCTNCPDLKRPVSIRRDKASRNWQKKKTIYDNSSLFVAAPSKWLMDCVDRSILKAEEKRIIPNGVNTKTFRRIDKQYARKQLGLPQECFIVMYASVSGGKRNPFKDYQTIEKAVKKTGILLRDEKFLFICIGGKGPLRGDYDDKRFTGHISDKNELSLYYNAADIFLHAANAESFGLTLIEAQACGTPVIATAVGGIPEIVEDGVTGYLVPRGDSEAMANKAVEIFYNSELQANMGDAATKNALKRFDLNQQVDNYISWYEELIDRYSLNR